MPDASSARPTASLAASRSPFWWGAWGEVGLIVCLFYVATPAPPPGVNEPHYLCRLQHAADPGYCPGDLFLESPDAHKTFVLAFSWATHWLSLTTVAWIGRLATWTALAWAWRRLMWTVVPRPLFATLAAAIVLTAIAEGNFAGEWLVGGFEAKPIAYVFVLLGLRAWVLNNWNWCWIHLGVASAWHVLVGGWSVLILLGSWLVEGRRHTSFVAMLPGLLGGGVLSLLGVIPALALNHGQPAELKAEAAEIYVFERLPHHLAPLHKPAAWIVDRGTRHLAVLALWFAAWIFYRRSQGQVAGTFLDTSLGRLTQYAVGALLLGAIGAAIELGLWDQPRAAAPWLRYYWFRLTDVAAPIALASLTIATLAAGQAASRRWVPVVLAAVLVAAGYPLALRFAEFYAQPVAVSDAKMRNPTDWVDACRWAREHTPADALFLTPRHGQSFKWHAARAEVVTYKDIPQDAAGLVEWRRRMYDVFKFDGNPALPWSPTLGQLGTTRMWQLADAYAFDYVLTTHDYPLQLPVVYANATYVVYQMP